PEMSARLRLDELHVDAHALAASLDAALESVAHAELPPDLPGVDGSAFVGKGGVACDDEGAEQPRKVRRQTLGDAVDEVVLLDSAAEVGERQHDEGKPRRPGPHSRPENRRQLRVGATSDRVRSDRPGDVLQRLLAEIEEIRFDLPSHLLVSRARYA